jgi:hypothetical protein
VKPRTFGIPTISFGIRTFGGPGGETRSGGPESGHAGGTGTTEMKKSATTTDESPSRLIDAKIEELGDWRGKTLSRVRALIKRADPDVVEEWKWSVPVWSHDGTICTGETYKRAVKLKFAKGASLPDPAGLFNSSLDGNVRRAIDIQEGYEMNDDAFAALIRAAAALNRAAHR